MIPLFPQFKQLALEDREGVEAFTHRFPPYSDFNFTSLWAWDTSNERKISILNNNLVVQFTDYSTHEPFLSFLGDTATEHTARTLIDYSKANGMPEELRFVPEIAVRAMRLSVLNCTQDKDNADYIYDVGKISKLQGSSFAMLRRNVARFWRAYQKVHVERIDFANHQAQDSVRKVLATWKNRKTAKFKDWQSEHEEIAIERIMQTAETHPLLLTGMFDDNILIAFSVEEILPNSWLLGHFWKADIQYTGIYATLINEKAKHFETLGSQSWNYEQDLGIEQLRIAKKAYRPIGFLDKYTVNII